MHMNELYKFHSLPKQTPKLNPLLKILNSTYDKSALRLSQFWEIFAKGEIPLLIALT